MNSKNNADSTPGSPPDSIAEPPQISLASAVWEAAHLAEELAPRKRTRRTRRELTEADGEFGKNGVGFTGGYSSARPDARDPRALGSMVNHLVKVRGWDRQKSVTTIFASWASIVGEDIAQHCDPKQLTDGELLIQARSTSWATQLRILTPQLKQRLASQVGPLVKNIKIMGPAVPSWRKGPRTVPGRGPRDTYG